MQHTRAYFRDSFAICALALSLVSCGGDNLSAPPTYVTASRPQIQQLLSDTQTPGAVVYVESPSGNWSESFGTAQRGTSTAIPATANFRVGSVTKTWTATVILQLVQEGKLSLADTVGQYIPNVPDGNTITIAELLGMRSGLFNYTRDLGFNQTIDATPGKVWTTNEMLGIAYSHAVDFAPGTSFGYSNTNTVLLGMLIEQLTGMSAADAMQARLFAPLGLTHTYLPPQTNTSIPAPFAHGYLWGTNAETAASPALSPARQAAAKNGTLQPTDVTSASASWGWTAGSGLSVASELAQFVKAMVNGTYLNASLQAQRLTTCTAIVPGNPNSPSYCLGIAKWGTYYGHNGQINGFNTFMVSDPKSKNTIVVWATSADSPNGTAPADAIGRILITELSKENTEDDLDEIKP